MRLVDVLARLQRCDQPVLETGDVAVIVGVGKAHASKMAARLAEAGHLLAPGQARCSPAWNTRRVDAGALTSLPTVRIGRG